MSRKIVDYNPDGTSLDDQEHRLRGAEPEGTSSDDATRDATRDFWPDETKKQPEIIHG